MSDISIPGVNSRFNTESLVQELVDAESIRLDRMREQLDEYQIERRVWQELNTNLGSLRSSTRNLFSFENPFNERIAVSSNEAVLRADAGRTAIEGITKIQIHQIAQADRFISRDLPIDMQIEKGIYRFVVGEQNVTLRFRGGSVQEFAAALNRRNPELIRSSVIRNRTDSQVILVESLKSGSSHVLAFEEDAAALATELGWTAPAVKISIRSPDSAVEGPDGEITLAPGEKMVLPFSEAVENTANLALRYDLRLVSELLPPPPLFPPGPEAPDSGSVSLGNVTLPNFPSTFTPPPQPEQEAIKTVEDYALIFARNGTQRTALPDVPNSENFVTVRIPLSEYTEGLDSLEISNVNTHKT
ncbi:MAG: flagellar cap protein FliD N-terminal domain-containing protein [Salinispira sp.]